MRVTTYRDAGEFLGDTRAALESEEACNSLMLGIGDRLVRYPERIVERPLLKAVHDDRGLVLAAIMTPPHNLVVYGHQGDLDDAARVLAAEIVGEAWSVPGVLGPAGATDLVAARLAEAAGRRHRHGWTQWLCEVRAVQTPAPERGRLRPATAADADLLGRWWYEFHVEIFGHADPQEGARAAAQRIADGDLHVWEDEGQPVSMANRTRPTRRGVSIGPVYTPPALRGRGYGTACVGELSRLLLAAGYDFCALFVDQTNSAAARVYERIGYRRVCDYHEHVLEG